MKPFTYYFALANLALSIAPGNPFAALNALLFFGAAGALVGACACEWWMGRTEKSQ